jgi:hypothetical protein
MMISAFFATITGKCGVWCKTKCNLWFLAKESPTYGVMCHFLAEGEILLLLFITKLAVAVSYLEVLSWHCPCCPISIVGGEP